MFLFYCVFQCENFDFDKFGNKSIGNKKFIEDNKQKSRLVFKYIKNFKF